MSVRVEIGNEVIFMVISSPCIAMGVRREKRTATTKPPPKYQSLKLRV